jgi:glyceraldehyde-3-phosphate dehydrogenase/erythrose-4-phosphate dehydrogenase
MAAQSTRARVAVNGYGVIGKRVADAAAAQEDMELVGVAGRSEIAGTLDDLLGMAGDLVRQ